MVVLCCSLRRCSGVDIIGRHPFTLSHSDLKYLAAKTCWEYIAYSIFQPPSVSQELQGIPGRLHETFTWWLTPNNFWNYFETLFLKVSWYWIKSSYIFITHNQILNCIIIIRLAFSKTSLVHESPELNLITLISWSNRKYGSTSRIHHDTPSDPTHSLTFLQLFPSFLHLFPWCSLIHSLPFSGIKSSSLMQFNYPPLEHCTRFD